MVVSRIIALVYDPGKPCCFDSQMNIYLDDFQLSKTVFILERFYPNKLFKSADKGCLIIVPRSDLFQTTSSPPFFLRDSTVSETRARMKPFLAWGDFRARSCFAHSIIPEEKWGTTRSLHLVLHADQTLLFLFK